MRPQESRPGILTADTRSGRSGHICLGVQRGEEGLGPSTVPLSLQPLSHLAHHLWTALPRRPLTHSTRLLTPWMREGRPADGQELQDGRASFGGMGARGGEGVSPSVT